MDKKTNLMQLFKEELQSKGFMLLGVAMVMFEFGFHEGITISLYFLLSYFPLTVC
jgi:hypothetical protein